jgi:hypothetical protein
VSIDAINSVMNHLDPAHDWTIQFMDIQYASLFKDDNTFEMSRTNPKSCTETMIMSGLECALSCTRTSMQKSRTKLYKAVVCIEWSKMITNLLQSIIDENVRSGFMHNDLHLENVVFDRDTYTLRTLDYGCYLGQSVHAKIHIEYRYHRRRRAFYKGIIDIPDMKKGWRWSNLRTTTKADYKTVAEDLRWSTDIMKVCVMYYTSCKQQTAWSL